MFDLGTFWSLRSILETSTNLGRTASILTATAIAQLALKHRQNMTLRQCIVVFVGSPLEDVSPDAERVLVRLAKKLKKNNVALDVIAFGDGIEEVAEGGRNIATLSKPRPRPTTRTSFSFLPAFFSS